MKNKLKMWRRLSAKQYDGNTEIRTGRSVRDAIRDAFANQYDILTTPLLRIFRIAEIDTPVYDAQMATLIKSED
jgi:hypothetical protein